MRYLLLIVACFVAKPILAQEAPELVLVAEKSLPYGFQQNSVEFHSDEIFFVTNTNMWLGKESAPPLGFFIAKKTAALKRLEDELGTLAEKARANSDLKSYISPHATKITIQGRMLATGTQEVSKAEEFFEKIWNAGEWRAKKGIKASYDNGKLKVISVGAESAKINPAGNKCRQLEQKTVFCTVDGFGYVYFNR